MKYVLKPCYYLSQNRMHCKDVDISVLTMCHLGPLLSVSSFKSNRDLGSFEIYGSRCCSGNGQLRAAQCT